MRGGQRALGSAGSPSLSGVLSCTAHNLETCQERLQLLSGLRLVASCENLLMSLDFMSWLRASSRVLRAIFCEKVHSEPEKNGYTLKEDKLAGTILLPQHKNNGHNSQATPSKTLQSMHKPSSRMSCNQHVCLCQGAGTRFLPLRQLTQS